MTKRAFRKSDSWKAGVLVVFLFVFLVPAIADAATLTRPPNNLGLVAFWPFDEGNGSVVDDVSGNELDASLENSPTWTTGRKGGALSFNGSDQYVDPPAISGIKSDPQTISVWFNPAEWNNNRVFSTITSLSGEGSNPDSGFHSRGYLRVNTDGTLLASLGSYSGGCSAIFMSPTSVSIAPLNQWTHVAIKYEFSPTFRVTLYVNGEEEDSEEHTTSCGNDMNEMWIGRRKGNNDMNGKIDDFRIYNRGLSDSEITQLYNSGYTQFNASPSLTETIPGLVGYWTFDGADLVSNVADSSGEGNNGHLQNFTSTTTAIGRIGQTLEFNGSDNYVQIDSMPALGTSFSVSAWLKPTDTFDKGCSGGASCMMVYKQSGLYFALSSAGKPQIHNGSTWLTTSSSISLDAWQHVVVTSDGSSVRFYIDGAQDGSVGLTGGNISSGTAYIGVRPDTINSAYSFNGAIDDMRVYDRTLSAAEIKRIYNATRPSEVNVSRNTLTSGLVGYWTFDGPNLLQNATDSSGLGNTGYLQNFTSTTTAIGAIGQGLDFDGSDDLMSILSDASLNLSDGGTVSLWINLSAYDDVWGLAEVNRYSDSNGWLFGVRGDNDGTNYKKIGLWAPTFGTFYGTTDVSLNEWHHIVWVFNPDEGNNYFYLDGTEDGSSAAGDTPTDASVDVRIGNYADGSRTTGIVDDVRIYDRPLSADEVKRLYNMGN